MVLHHRRFRLEPRLAWILGELRESPHARELTDRTTRLAETQDSPTGQDLGEALGAHRFLLDRAADGLDLTAAGYLRPAVVRAVADHLPLMQDWRFAVERESHTQPVLHFRESVQRAGLLRKQKGKLLLTSAGKRARSDPAFLWGHLADRLVTSRRQFDDVAGILVLLHLATDGDVDTRQIADLLQALGWRRGDGSPVDRMDVQWIYNDLWAALGNVGAPVSGRGLLARHPSPEALALIRDALLEEAPWEDPADGVAQAAPSLSLRFVPNED
ncbi:MULTISPECIES: hypothetical protein [unclassified Nocardioides]|uniref:hypothetical protein n=1 Tax=unclassified Nocardioides TaxID=2615069 RepID=UPI0006F91B71|nr:MULTISPECIES: hypothetical protein [unclassified Nocardioides]KRA37833.1 hypothetical protein ASD81_03845 [Nocardioides sp. Root614]KRA91793.1 hypothetical protein ASD84_04110 [Nocardioides sp. Root682]